MNFKDYEDRALATAVYKDKGKNFTYTVLGLTGEAGEVADKYKKIIRVPEYIPNRSFTEEEKKVILLELGDVLWYVAACAYELGSGLDEVANMNLGKLASRKDRGVLHGSGDNR